MPTGPAPPVVSFAVTSWGDWLSPARRRLSGRVPGWRRVTASSRVYVARLRVSAALAAGVPDSNRADRHAVESKVLRVSRHSDISTSVVA